MGRRRAAFVAEAISPRPVQRQEAFEAFTQILTARPELTSTIGDLYFRNADFPHADEAASTASTP